MKLRPVENLSLEQRRRGYCRSGRLPLSRFFSLNIVTREKNLKFAASRPARHPLGFRQGSKVAVSALLCALLLGNPCAECKNGDEKDQTDWPSVIAGLRRDSQRRRGFLHTRQQLAIALNNYGVKLAEEGELDLARKQIEEAMQLDPENGRFATNLASVYLKEAHEYYGKRAMKKAKAVVGKAIELDSDIAQAYVLLGEIEYNQQQLTSAQTAWQRAIELDPYLEEVHERLTQLNEELPIESEFGRISQAYFDLRYEDNIDRPRGFDIRDALLRARREVGSDFAYWPKYRIVALIYSAESFRALRNTPEWVGGQYDGKIRVPLPDSRMGEEMVRTIIFHEYAHAIVHDVAKGKCPRWFDEGIAEHEGRKNGVGSLHELKLALAQDKLISWSELNNQFSGGLRVARVALGYQQSYSIVRYLVERYGFWRIRRILKSLADGGEFEEIFSKEFHISLERLQRNWRNWLPRLLSQAQ